MLKVNQLKLVDLYVGRILVRLLSKPPVIKGNITPKSILIIRPGGIGDAVHLAPTIQRLQQYFPEVSIDLLAEQRNAGAFSLTRDIRRVYLYDRPRQLLKLLSFRYDLVIDTEQWHRLSAVVARLVQSPVKIGYASNERKRLFTHAVPYSHDDYEAVSFLRLLEPLGNHEEALPLAPWLQVPASAVETAAELLGECGARLNVVLFPGASIAERRWGAEKFRAVAQWCGERGMGVVVVGGGGERDEASLIAVRFNHVLNLAGRTSLAETAAILERAAVVVSGDSGILHIAVGLGRPTVSLFGSGISAKWAPRGESHVVLNKKLPCSPCTRFGYTPACPHNVRCMREITVNEVTKAIEVILKRT